MTKKPLKISLVTTSYNRATTIASAIESVLAQTYTDYEVILVDDGSTDGSSRLCDSFVSANPKNNNGLKIKKTILARPNI